LLHRSFSVDCKHQGATGGSACRHSLKMNSETALHYSPKQLSGITLLACRVETFSTPVFAPDGAERADAALKSACATSSFRRLLVAANSYRLKSQWMPQLVSDENKGGTGVPPLPMLSQISNQNRCLAFPHGFRPGIQLRGAGLPETVAESEILDDHIPLAFFSISFASVISGPNPVAGNPESYQPPEAPFAQSRSRSFERLRRV
jgi:hypothetical protein